MAEQTYIVEKIDGAGYRIEENGVRALLLEGTQRALLVDTGFGSGDLKALVGTLTALPVTLVNTHTDRDHIGCNALFPEAYMHPAEYDRYSAGDSPAPPRPLWEGDVLDLGGRRFEVVLIPGHTPGSIALLDGDHRVLVSGDSVQDGNIFLFGPGRNLAAYVESLRKLDAMRHRFDAVYPSHGSFPLDSGVIPSLLAGAERLLAGELTGKAATVMDMEVEVYDAGVARFLYK